MRRLLFLTPILVVILVASSCATVKRDRCYLPETRYMRMKVIFTQTNSYQRVAQAMSDEQWAGCSVNEFRYRLRKDLGLEGAEFDTLFTDLEPEEQALDFYPGQVKRVAQ